MDPPKVQLENMQQSIIRTTNSDQLICTYKSNLCKHERVGTCISRLPPNVTTLLQPMDQSVIETLKRLYRKQLLRRKTLNKAWNRVLNRENDNSITNTDDSISEDMNEVMSKLQICQDCDDDDDMKEWVTYDSNDKGFPIMSDEEIVENILQINEQQEMQEDETEENVDVENDTGISHDVAFHTLETALKWFEKQTESDSVSLLQLKLIRDIAAMKRKSCLHQMTITKYFKPN
ncbi:hypothetical protein HHI36_019997 [Cryptolaemus montrouzieri]|uniref:DDE-1 domain-containing protein n=1 Tax=Cryptolaemus montrouzieri TaxID=559131 RepID=A0ABD2N9B3_9CUCU